MLGYPCHLEQPPALTTGLSNEGTLLLEPFKPEPTATPKRRGRPNITRVPVQPDDEPLVNLPVNRRYDIVYQGVRRAVINATDNEHLPLDFYQDIEDEHYQDTIDYARRNIGAVQQIGAHKELTNYYRMGEALNRAFDNAIMVYPDLYTSWSTIGRENNLTVHQIKTARRTWELFRCWPEAIEYSPKSLTVRAIGRLSNEECQVICLRLLIELLDIHNPKLMNEIMVVI